MNNDNEKTIKNEPTDPLLKVYPTEIVPALHLACRSSKTES